MQCPNCGYDNSRGNRFCVRCGIDLTAAPAPAAPAAGSPAPPPPPGAPAEGMPPPPPTSWGAPPPPTPWAAPAGGSAPPPPGGPPMAPPPGTPPSPPNPFAPPTPYGPPGGYPAPGPYGQYAPPYAPSGYGPPPTNGLAIASLVLGLVGWIPCGVGSIVAVILGFVARNQIRASNGRQGGDGLALAGIILGFLAIAFVILIIVISVASNSHTGQS